MQQQIHPTKIRQVLFLAVVIILGIVIIKEMYFMLGAFLGAITLYVVMSGPMNYLVVQKKWKRWAAALLLMLLSFIILVIPVAWLTSVAIQKISPIIQNPTSLNIILEQIHQYLLVHFKIDILNKSNVAKLSAEVTPFIRNAIGSTLSTLGNLLILYLILYFMLTQTFEMESWLIRNVPFKNSNVQKITTECRSLVYSNAIGIPIVALLQGFVGLIGYWIFGVEEFILMGILTAICSMIPVVGSMIVYMPLVIYQLSIGHTWQGIAIALWGLLIVGTIDNVARFMLQKKLADVHPLITLIGVVIGINMFGFLGIIFGPLILSLFILLVKIYVDEFGVGDANPSIE